MRAQQRTPRRKPTSIALAAGITVLLLPPAVAAGQPEALDRSFGDRGRVVTKMDLGGPSWLGSDVDIAEGPNETIVMAFGHSVLRYLSDGSLDPTSARAASLWSRIPKGFLSRLAI